MIKYPIAILLSVCFLTSRAQEPSVPNLTAVSIDPATGRCVVRWSTPNPSDNVVRHEISRLPFSNESFYFVDPPTGTAYAPDTVFTESVGNIETDRQMYRIRSVNGINNVSPITDAHVTMILGGTYDPCNNEFKLNWTKYRRYYIDNSTGRIDESDSDAKKFNDAVEYEIWGHNGSTFDPERSVKLSPRLGNNDNTDFIVSDPAVNTNYFLFVKAVLPSKDTASSNLIKISTENKKLPEKFVIDSVISSGGNIYLHFNVDRTAETDTFALRRSDITNRPVRWFNKLSDLPETYEDREISLGQVYTYTLQTYLCGKPVKTADSVSNLLLNAVPRGQNAELKWTRFIGKESEVIYTLYRTAPDEPRIIYRGTDLSFTDAGVPDYICSGPKRFCYQVTAFNGETTARSETACLTVEPVITMPDAIDPKSETFSTPDCSCRFGCRYYRNRFGPILDINDNYFELTMEIFNRAGTRLFGVKKGFNAVIDPALHYWDGTFKGEYVPEGVYVYSIKIDFADHGKSYSDRGTVTVVYRK